MSYIANSRAYGRTINIGSFDEGWTFLPAYLVQALALGNAIAAIDRTTLRKAACAAIMAGAVLSWAPSARAYYGLAYPSDVLYSLRIDTTRLPAERMLCELQEGTSYASPGPLDRTTRYPYTGATNYLLLNFCQGPPSGQRLAPDLENAGHERLYDGRHWMTFPAYGFEVYLPAARDLAARNGYRVRAYRLHD